MKTLARDRRTLRVCACGWGCPGCLRVLCKTCARLLKIFARSPRGFCRGNAKKRSAKTLQNRPQNRPQIHQNGFQMRPGTPSGEGRERGGKQNEKEADHHHEMGSFWDPQIALFFAFGLRALFGRRAKLSSLAAFLRFAPFPFFGRPGCPLECLRGLRGSL